MDIRSAKMPRRGAMPQQHVAAEPEPARGAEVGADGTIRTTKVDGSSPDVVIQGYVDYLAANGIGKEEIGQVMEVLLTTGSVSWDFELFDSIPVSLVVRPAWVDSRISEILDQVSSETPIVSNVHYNNIVAECNLAASLARYGEKSFRVRTPEDLEQAREFCRNLPYVMQNALVRKLAVFDRLLAAATSDWAIKNFTKPPLEKSERN